MEFTLMKPDLKQSDLMKSDLKPIKLN